MIYEIATLLQDVLDKTWVDPSEEVALDQERAAKEQAVQEKTRENEMLQRQRELQLQQEEERSLNELVLLRESRSAKRGLTTPTQPSEDIFNQTPPGVLRFERPSRNFRTPKGQLINIDTVYGRVRYRRGPISETFAVWPFSSSKADNKSIPSGSEKDETHRDTPFLILKECFIQPNSLSEPVMKRAIQNLESKLELHLRLSPHRCIIKPLNFEIQRVFGTDDDDDPAGKGWNICVLTELADKNSLQETLEVVDKLEVKLIRAWAVQILEGLHHYHRHGVAHANLHLKNILLQRDHDAEKGHGSITVVRLSDGGYQQVLHLLKTGAIPNYCTPAWTAPEISKQKASIEDDPANPAADIWDFGRCFLQMAFGVEIMNQYTSGPFQLIEDLPLTSSLEALLRQIFNGNPKKRPSAWDLLHYEFFRSDDSLFASKSASDSIELEASTAGLPADPLVRFRRDSAPAAESFSRYAKEFTEEGRLGRGGFGEVFRARNKIDGQLYAVKKVKARSRGALDPVLSEVTVLSQLKHPNVVRYFASWIEDTTVTEQPELFGSSEDENTSSLAHTEHASIMPMSSRGLDFISSNNGGVMFADDEDEITSSEEDQSDSSEESLSSGQLGSPHHDKLKKVNKSALNNQHKHERLSTQASHTLLYIQMEYCKQEVWVPGFRLFQ